MIQYKTSRDDYFQGCSPFRIGTHTGTGAGTDLPSGALAMVSTAIVERETKNDTIWLTEREVPIRRQYGMVIVNYWHEQQPTTLVRALTTTQTLTGLSASSPTPTTITPLCRQRGS